MHNCALGAGALAYGSRKASPVIPPVSLILYLYASSSSVERMPSILPTTSTLSSTSGSGCGEVMSPTSCGSLQVPPLEEDEPPLDDEEPPDEEPPDDEDSPPLEEGDPPDEELLEELRPGLPELPLSGSSIVGSSLLQAVAEATAARQPRARTLETKRGAKLGIPVG